ncbi:MAG: CBS domain-containing protein [Cyanothece sp. SIO1E1]|nr:CBS domain-containing protein [Cyanothece sp. SIO1E1]
MYPDAQQLRLPALEDAIDRNPLVLPPETPLPEAIALMGQAQSRSCDLVAGPLSSGIASTATARCSCILVVEGKTVIGIFTERDIVRLTATGTHFASVTIADVMAHPVITLPQTAFQDVFAALFLFRRYRIRHLPILDEQGQLVGVVSPESIRRVLQPANLLKLRRVSEVMTKQVIHATLTTPVLRLAQLMAAYRVSCVVILEADQWPVTATPRPEETEDTTNNLAGRPVGIVTERDIVQFQALKLDLASTQAAAVMSTPLFLLHPEDSLWVTHQEMQRRRVRRLVVSWNWGTRLGIVTQTSLLRIFDPVEMYGVIETLQRTVDHLQTPTQDPLEPPNLPLTSSNSDPPTSLPTSKHIGLAPTTPRAVSGSPQIDLPTRTELQAGLTNMQTRLEQLAKAPDLEPKARQTALNSVLATLEQMQAALQDDNRLSCSSTG